MEGVELASAFSCAPNKLGLCGPKKFDRSTLKSAERSLKKFLAPHTYLSIIAQANGLAPYDYDVAEAFWIGNRLLESVKREDIRDAILEKFTHRGLSRQRAAALAESLPERVLPHHSFHVFYIGSITGVLKGTSHELDSCRVSWGRFVGSTGGKFRAIHLPIKISGGKLLFSHKRVSLWSAWHGKPPENGERITAHWGQAAIPIGSRQEKNLLKYTRINMGLYSKRPGAFHA